MKTYKFRYGYIFYLKSKFKRFLLALRKAFYQTLLLLRNSFYKALIFLLKLPFIIIYFLSKKISIYSYYLLKNIIKKTLQFLYYGAALDILWAKIKNLKKVKKKEKVKKEKKADKEEKKQDSHSFIELRVGYIFIFIFISLFIIWGSIAPINSASIAQGVVTVDFNKKVIQHFEGGIIEKILIKEGTKVKKGDELLILQSIQAKAQNTILIKQLITAKAIAKRLEAERDFLSILDLSFLRVNDGNVIFANLDVSENDLKDIITSQYAIYRSKKEHYFSRIDILNKKIIQLSNEIEALEAQKKAVKEQIYYSKKELKIIARLVKEKNAPYIEQLALQKEISNLKGQNGSLSANVSKSLQQISEIDLEIINFSKENLNAVLEELQKVNLEISNFSEELLSSTDILKRTKIIAPVSGIVMGLKYHTKGAVIASGEEILNIVPQGTKLIIEAKIRPQDIAKVREGLVAKVNLSAFKDKNIPKLEGLVEHVSADVFKDENTGENFFLARIVVLQEELDKLKEDIKLQPGMSSEVFIITGKRTLLSYLLKPLQSSTYKAFRE